MSALSDWYSQRTPHEYRQPDGAAADGAPCPDCGRLPDDPIHDLNQCRCGCAVSLAAQPVEEPS